MGESHLGTHNRQPLRVLLLVVTLAACEGAQPGPSASPIAEPVEPITIDLVPHWIAGETRSIEITKGRTENNPDIGEITASATTPIEITVLEQTEDGYVIQWVYGEARLDSGELPSDPMIDVMTSMANGLRFEFGTDELGIPTGLRNWEEVEASLKETVNLMFDFIEGQGMAGGEIESIRQALEPLMSSRELMEALSSDEIGLYHLPFGGIYDLAIPVSSSDLLPNVFGGDPFPAQAEITLVSYDPQSERAIFRWTMTPDPERTHEIIMQTMIDLAESSGAEPPQESDLPDPFSIKDEAEYVIDVASGWVLSVEYQREIIIGSRYRSDTTRIVDTTE